MEGQSQLVGRDDSLAINTNNATMVMDVRSGPVVQDGVLLHQHEFEDNRANQDEQEEEEVEGLASYSSQDTIMPDFQPDQDPAEGNSTISTNQASSSSSAIPLRTARKTGHTDRSETRFRTGQRITAHGRVVKQLHIRTKQLGSAKGTAKAELMTEFKQHVAAVEAQAQATENVRMTELVSYSVVSLALIVSTSSYVCRLAPPRRTRKAARSDRCC